MNISQREARQLRKQVKQLRDILRQQRNSWATEWPGGARAIATFNGWGGADLVPVAVKTARACGHAVVVLAADNGDLTFVALPHAAVPA